MNDRIKELLIKSFKEIGPNDTASKEKTLQRFAELIIEECANAVDGYYGNERQLIYQAPLQILNHFGANNEQTN